MRIIRLTETDSTNRWLSDYGGEDELMVVADHQTVGRGCGANRWESEAGMNLLFSIRIFPEQVPAGKQFVLSAMIALAMKEVLDAYTDGICVKWPNDIYWHDRKMGGILIENRLAGQQVRSSIIGVGLNVNQETFRSDAPNPVSLRNVTGRAYPLDGLLAEIEASFDKYYGMVNRREYQQLFALYRQSLYRREGYHVYCDAGGGFEALLQEVREDGTLVLIDRKGAVRRYAFKEVTFVVHS